MKYLIASLSLCLVLIGCSTKKVDDLAKTYEPVVEKDAQVSRANEMIKNDPHLDQEKKKKLIELVNTQSLKMSEMRKRQSQLRAVLIDQLLTGSDGSATITNSTTSELEKLNKQGIKELRSFILKFQSISGEKDIRSKELTRDVVDRIHY